MPFLVVNNQMVPVAVGGASEEIEIVGDRARAFDGTMRSTRRSVKRRWKVKTPPLSLTDARGLRTFLLATPQMQCEGDLLGGPVRCDVEVTNAEFVAVSGGARQAVEFTLHEV